MRSTKQNSTVEKQKHSSQRINIIFSSSLQHLPLPLPMHTHFVSLTVPGKAISEMVQINAVPSFHYEVRVVVSFSERMAEQNKTDQRGDGITHRSRCSLHASSTENVLSTHKASVDTAARLISMHSNACLAVTRKPKLRCRRVWAMRQCA